MNIKHARNTLECFREMIISGILTDDDIAQIAAIMFRRLNEIKKEENNDQQK